MSYEQVILGELLLACPVLYIEIKYKRLNAGEWQVVVSQAHVTHSHPVLDNGIYSTDAACCRTWFLLT